MPFTASESDEDDIFITQKDRVDGIVTFGETKLQHFESSKNCEWFLGDTKVEELYEYKNLGVLKNYVGSFSPNIDDKIDKTRKKVGMIFSSNLDRRKVNPLIYAKFWRQACLPTLLFGDELLHLFPLYYQDLNVAGPCFSKIFSMFLNLHLVLFFKICRV